MHTALHFQQGGQIIVQKRNTRCLCSPSGIIIQVRPGKSTKICSNKRSCFTPTMDTIRTNIETKTMPKKNIFRDHSKSMRNHNITTSAISCKPEGISQFLQSLCLYNRDKSKQRQTNGTGKYSPSFPPPPPPPAVISHICKVRPLQRIRKTSSIFHRKRPVTLQISLIPKFIKKLKELKTQMDRCNIPITP